MRITGVRIIEELRALPEMRNFPIVLCTDAADDDAADDVVPLVSRLQLLDVPVVIKPFELAEFEQTLSRALRPIP